MVVAVAEAIQAKVRLLAIAHNDGEYAWAYDLVHGVADRLPADAAAGVDVVVDGEPALVLLTLASDAGTTLCLSAHDRPWEGGSALGRVGAAVVERATQPLLLVTENSSPPLAHGDVVVALDGVSDPGPTLASAVAWANRLGVALRLVTVYEPVPADVRQPDHYTRRHGPPGDADAYLDGLRRSIGETVAAGCRCVAIADPVSVATGLSEHLAAAPALMVVVGVHERRHWLTTEARGLLQSSPPPVLVVPHHHPG
jgi:hypothetical protein